MAKASLILRGGKIYPDSGGASVPSIAIVDDRVMALGSDQEVEATAARGTEVVDLGGRAVLPGLTDAHLHLEGYARSLRQVDCETRTLEECLRRVADRSRTSRPGEWLLGHGWNQNEWGRYGTAAELDAAAAGHPVYLTAKSLHAAWASGAALAAAGIDRTTPDPPGGRIDRLPDGSPSGILFESASQLVAGRLPRLTPSEFAEDLSAALLSLVRFGLTRVHDFDGPRVLTALQQLRDEERLPLRVVKHIQRDQLDSAIDLGLATGFGDAWIRFGNLKLFSDGALGPRTAFMLEPYQGEPGNTGMGLLSAPEIADLGHRAGQAGLGLAIHAIGDRANREVLTALETLGQGLPPGAGRRLRHRIEHVQILHPSDVTRLAALGVIASMQPIHAPSDMLMADRYWGARVRHAYAWRSLADAGVRLAFGSDAPVESPNPFWGLHAAVTRRRHDGTPGPDGWVPEERLPFSLALRAYTMGTDEATATGLGPGTLTPGAAADLIVLDRDPWTVEAQELHAIRPVAAIVGGVFHHRQI